MTMRLSQQRVFYLGCMIFALTLKGCGSVNRSNVGFSWGMWSQLPLSCSVTCGQGVRCRVRKCLDGFGNEEPITHRCHSPEDHDSKAKMCTPCIVSAQCPSLPGWGVWSPWSECTTIDKQDKSHTESCQLGIRTRRRKCDNPPPEPPPHGVPCSGDSHQIVECRHNCDKRPLIQPKNIAKRIQLRVEADHRKGLRDFKRVLRKQVSESAEMSCNTPAYRLAKRLTVTAEFDATKRGVSSKPLRITWHKNGKPLYIDHSTTKVKKMRGNKIRKKTVAGQELQQEHDRWEALHINTFPEIKDDKLIFSSIREGDRGFYTCELSWGEHRWITIFYSLVVTGMRYVAQETDTFYLHSNIGYENALREAPVWLEAAQITWELNGMIRSKGLVARTSRRIQKIPELNQTHSGIWTCYLIIPATGPTSRMSTPWVRVSGVYLLNEFRLRVVPSVNDLWQLANHPASIRMLRNISVSLAVICELLLLLLLLTIWATKRWLERTLSASQKKLIIQEVIDNATRLMLTARKRAAVNRDRLLPLIIREQKRLKKASQHLNERFLDDYLEEEEPATVGGSVWRRISKFGGRVRTISNIFKKVNARSSATLDVEGWRYSRSGSIVSTDSRPSNTAERVSKLKSIFGIGEDTKDTKDT